MMVPAARPHPDTEQHDADRRERPLDPVNERRDFAGAEHVPAVVSQEPVCLTREPIRGHAPDDRSPFDCLLGGEVSGRLRAATLEDVARRYNGQ